MTRSTRKGRSAEPGNIKTINTRLEKLESDLNRSVHDLKKQLLDGGDELSNNDECVNTPTIIDKIEKFENTMKQSIVELRLEIVKAQEEMDAGAVKHKQECLLNAIVINGIKEKDSEDLICQVSDIFNNQLKKEVRKNDINFAYRLGKKDNQGKTTRPVVVMFVNRWLRDVIFVAKRGLKGSGVVINEMLVSSKVKLYKRVRSVVGIKCCWTWRGNIYALVHGNKIIIKNEADVEGLL